MAQFIEGVQIMGALFVFAALAITWERLR